MIDIEELLKRADLADTNTLLKIELLRLIRDLAAALRANEEIFQARDKVEALLLKERDQLRAENAKLKKELCIANQSADVFDNALKHYEREAGER